ncbi:Uncharacterized conserved protein YbjT, contains NAD(P)-binding and DUF2867 domains [Thermostaphylospora chromogena]|uniref:Uncharacterized conserved protein YbjT, contains NAD(P)-binding and DUF2867 domains n=1 Tax=Thermostaphylospora chromogena TaxID=35622 RepID=A0A1H1GWC7_9ACTN|nr:Uncharacterized conserved protein YbjT, contains NAD(P)-binding and DUF2867 domains [Thermostaphylospora chromogena]
MRDVILVTGATGTIGREVVRLLAGRGEAVRAMSRTPSRVPSLPGVHAVPGDFHDPASLERAVAGVTGLFLLTAAGPHVPAHDLAMIEAAVAGSVRKVVKLSVIGADTAGAPGSAWHAPGEDAVRTSGMAWTLLRPSTFASNTLAWADMIAAGKPVPSMTGDGRQGVVDPRDVAEVAVEALTSTAHDGKEHTLTGPELISEPGQAAVLERILGRPVTTVDVPLERAREQLIASGAGAEFADMAVSGFASVREGRNAVVTPDVEEILGRPAVTFETWARDHRDAFARPPSR